MASITARLQRTSAVRPSPFARDLSYFTARAIEELDRAEAASDEAARRVHEQLATQYLRIALRLRTGDVAAIVADRVD